MKFWIAFFACRNLAAGIGSGVEAGVIVGFQQPAHNALDAEPPVPEASASCGVTQLAGRLAPAAKRVS